MFLPDSLSTIRCMGIPAHLLNCGPICLLFRVCTAFCLLAHIVPHWCWDWIGHTHSSITRKLLQKITPIHKNSAYKNTRKTSSCPVTLNNTRRFSKQNDCSENNNLHTINQNWQWQTYWKRGSIYAPGKLLVSVRARLQSGLCIPNSNTVQIIRSSMGVGTVLEIERRSIAARGSLPTSTRLKICNTECSEKIIS